MYNPSRVLLRLFVSLSFGLAFPASAQTQSHVFVKNETQHPLRIHKSEVGGAKVSAKAWRQGVERVSPSNREIVLTLNRKGKVNWMDPTPCPFEGLPRDHSYVQSIPRFVTALRFAFVWACISCFRSNAITCLRQERDSASTSYPQVRGRWCKGQCQSMEARRREGFTQ